ncbi:MAG: hypothetical protein LBR82_08785 [Desulfovibrio sp.]|jgi:3-oxoacyl-[acyl-carrier-protein] synthase II|nr:hypothetical protein [Desulfovibrio sp.]
MKLAVDGTACLGSFGTGMEALLRGAPLPAVHADGRAVAADTSALKARLPARALRQIDHFSRMALLCALNALEDAGIPESPPRDTGIILVSGYGPATPTFEFQDSILAYGEILASPLAFSRSVQNIPAATLAVTLHLVGPCATVCRGDFPVADGLCIARQWLEEGRVERVLFGAVDEYSPLLARLTRLRVGMRASRAGREGLRAALPVSEGAVFFCLTADKDISAFAGKCRRGCIEDILFGRAGNIDPPDNTGVGTRGEVPVFLSGAVPRRLRALPGMRHVGHVYGNIPIAQAFDAISALSCGNGLPAGRALCLAHGTGGRTACLHVRQAENRGGAS